MRDLVFDMVAAGVEGGSKTAIERDWTLIDAQHLLERWKQTPPLPVMAALIGQALGIKLDHGPRSPGGVSSTPADVEAGLLAELGHLPTITYVAPARGVPLPERLH